MTFQVHEAEQLSIEQMREFLQGSRQLTFARQGRAAVYQFLKRVLQARRYDRCTRAEKGVVRAYLAKLTGLSRAQITRLIGRWSQTREVRPLPPRRPSFPRRYRSSDIALLAQVDAAHEDLSGPAIRRILQREYTVFGKAEFERLSQLSVSHLYNLRRSAAYRRRRVRVETTQGKPVSIAERRRPDPQGKPGYLRVDTVHQGQQDGKAGPYHINSVDTVTQWEVLGCCQAISENHLIPVLEEILDQYPFRILGFHSDNGSEYLNHRVAAMLNKLLVEFTKSRSCRSTDNALVEGKNGAVVRKHMGYGLIGSEWAEPIHGFYREHLNPYLNYHRPCGFATMEVDARGKRRRHYRPDDYRTPYEKLTALPREWAEDRARRRRAGVPEEIEFQTKPEIALAQIARALDSGLPCGVVLADAGYGSDTRFRERLAEMGLQYGVGVEGSARELVIETGRGALRRVAWREGSHRKLQSRFVAVRVRPAHRDYWRAEPHEELWLLAEWPRGSAEPTKYWLANLPAETTLEQLVRLAKHRWIVERDYLELKQELPAGAF